MLNYDRRIMLTALGAGAPAVAVAIVLLYSEGHGAALRLTLTVLVLATWISLALSVRKLAVFPLRTISNLLDGMREGDYTLRSAWPDSNDAPGQAARALNSLGEELHGQRLSVVEATALLKKVMGEIDVAICAFDAGNRLRLMNEQAEQLLGRPSERLMGQSAADLQMSEFLAGETPRIVDLALPGGSGRWELRRATFRERGMPHQLVVLSDLTRTLHAEERQAWHRLVQILRHEVNNTLAPISSLAGSLENLVEHRPRAKDWQQDLHKGLNVIAERSAALNRFMASYVRLTRLPLPQFGDVNVSDWIRDAASLETRTTVAIVPGPDVTIQADKDQLGQLLVNLMHNAVDAALETGGGVRVGWAVVRLQLEVWIEDEGPGLPKDANLFVPFFTTKSEGAGIGLVLSRQIAEMHGGALTLADRTDRRGCRASLRLPLLRGASGMNG